jgi:alkylation response protein AidB-like acyl-CoA dehydrogenase
VRGFLAEQATMAHVRAALESEEGWSPEIWRGLGAELGFAGLAISEEQGGAGLDVSELAAVAEELGATLAPIPWFETSVLSVALLKEAGAPALLSKLAGGACIATVAWRAASGRPGEIGPILSGGKLSGAAHYVSFAHAANLLLVMARTDKGLALCAIDADAPGVEITRDTSLDLTRPLSHVSFNDVPATPLMTSAEDRLRRAFAVASAVLAAEQVGGMARVLEDTVAYSKTRVQFGRVIGSFQAMKHRMADMKLELESARSAAAWALDAIQGNDSDLLLACSGAHAACSDAYLKIASEGIQLIGGVGFTWEHSAHLFFKRARASSNLLDPPWRHRDIIAHALLDQASI